ncbi:MAG: hypothetical protein JRD89_15830, partial [Deltaproteobacteria bacterium]|nr:hypothetical protein [Deltaproteobacteria bacterium]
YVEIGEEGDEYQLGIHAEGVYGRGRRWRLSAYIKGEISGLTTPDYLVLLNDPPGNVKFNRHIVQSTDDWDGIDPTEPEALEEDIIIDAPDVDAPEDVIYDAYDLEQQLAFLDRLGAREYKILSLFASFKEKLVILFGGE